MSGDNPQNEETEGFGRAAAAPVVQIRVQPDKLGVKNKDIRQSLKVDSGEPSRDWCEDLEDPEIFVEFPFIEL